MMSFQNVEMMCEVAVIVAVLLQCLLRRREPLVNLRAMRCFSLAVPTSCSRSRVQMKVLVLRSTVSYLEASNHSLAEKLELLESPAI